LGESTPTFGAKRPTSSVLSLLFVPPIVSKKWNKKGKGIEGKRLDCWAHCFETEEAVLPQQNF
jgi:hypothetical protein